MHLTIPRLRATQYTRCAVQQPDNVHNCTAETTKRLGFLPSVLFIYSGASQCDSKLWTFVYVAVGIAQDLAFFAFLLWWRRLDGVFSWLMFMVQLASGVGVPLLEATILNRRAYGLNQQLLILSLALLQPTASPITATLSAIYLSKGLAFQVLAVDAITAISGMTLIMVVTTGEILAAGTTYLASGGNSQLSSGFLALVGALLAVGPWALVYLLIGVITIPLQLCFILGFFELCLSKTTHFFDIAINALSVGLGILIFIALTPIWALWDLGWKVRQIIRQRRAQLQPLEAHSQKAPDEKVPDEKAQQADGIVAEKPIFPMARRFRRKFEKAKRWQRALIKVVFVLFLILSMASFVGRWMFTVNILNATNDAYCPSGFRDAVLAGLGLKFATLGTGVGGHLAGLL